MSTSGKIRLLLALLFASLLFTAIVVQSTYTPVKNLEQTARILEDNLHRKEAYVSSVLHDKAGFEKLKAIKDDPQAALKYIQYFTSDRSIWLLTTDHDTLTFWSGIKVIPDKLTDIKEGVSFIRQPNGYYEAIKKTEGSFSALFFIPIKIDYAFENQYLQNIFARDLLDDDNIEIAGFPYTDVYGVHSSIDGSYLFSVKLKPGMVNHRFFYFEFVAWILTFIILCMLVHNFCKYFVDKGYSLLALLLLALFIGTVRYLNLHYNWPDFVYKLKIFGPESYSSSKLFPSLGDFCLNILFLSWFVAFMYRQRHNLFKISPAKFISYVIVILCSAILLLTSTALLNLFYGLVINSKINFDVYNIFNLSRFSVCGLLMLCFSFMIFFLLNEVFLTICYRLPVPDSHKALIFLISILAATILISHYQNFNLFYILLAIPVFIRGYAYRNHNGELTSSSFTIIVFICALISFLRYEHVQVFKENSTRRTLVHELETPDDPSADYIFRKIEGQIINDTVISRYLNDTLQYKALKNRFQKLYFDGYLSKYNYNIHEFDGNGQSLISDKDYSLNVFKDMVLYSSFKVSNYFYRENESFGFQNYFAILPIIQQGRNYGTIVVELKAKPLQPAGSFPELLKDGNIRPDNEYKNYSYAFYSDNKLVSKSGNYNYDLINSTFNAKTGVFTTMYTEKPGTDWYKGNITYSNLIYKISDRNMIVVTREDTSLFYTVTSLTFFFILLLAFSLAVIGVRWLWYRIKILNVSDNHLRWIFKINFDKILYKTRIQFSIVSAVVLTLIVVGFITFLSISTQYNEQQDKMIRDKISRITTAFESGLFDKYINNISDESQVDFDELANTYSTDLILYDLNGRPLITTQPKIYDDGLLTRRMNSRAYIALSKLRQSEFVNEEVIGNLRYKAVYAPLINSKNETVAYLQLPYFSNEVDYNTRILSLLNVMINVYALIFIVVGLFAVIIARQITTPLSFMQYNLSKIGYGKKNEPIKWERDDEIGALVTEYNNMIAELENSAQKLAQSERESAWREMAKQVAHEIKNPLTPLKLGLQLLEKSWRDKDPKFDQKFERFSKSFVEQIESLSSIAQEFSSFAKMPDTQIERINIFEMLGQAVIIFKQMDNISINYEAPDIPFFINADRDQLLRCFNNLLKNAIEAIPHGTNGVINIDYQINSNNVLLKIKDNGNGIPENMREKIFAPNFTTKSSGTGLGLAFVKNSIENANGKVWFETAMGEGTTFYLSLPAA